MPDATNKIIKPIKAKGPDVHGKKPWASAFESLVASSQLG